MGSAFNEEEEEGKLGKEEQMRMNDGD